MFFHGGEIKHTKGCVFYPDSLTQYNQLKIDALKEEK